ncbi:MAG: ATP-dependent RecD-like DNA helicase [Flavobacteriales bacterium]
MRDKIIHHLGHQPTSGQEKLISLLAEFLSGSIHRPTFILRGYAGTGKTSLISAFIKSIEEYKITSVLLAPTGRAAKVLSSYSGRPAYTVHKKIYFHESKDGVSRFVLQKNIHKNTVFFVDEASMIANSGGLGGSFVSKGGSLLEDLVRYVFAGENCRLIFIGDTAQLPPVGMDVSLALDKNYLQKYIGLSVFDYELTEVVRQSAKSGILYNATKIRDQLKEKLPGYPAIELSDFPDVASVNSYDVEEILSSAYAKVGVENAIVICRSNKSANQFNQQIRYRIRWQEDEIASGDYLMVVKNNYFWLGDESKAGFIANGDMVYVERVMKFEEKYGFRFVNLQIRLVDYPGEPELEVKVMLDTLMTDAPALTREQGKQFQENVYSDYLIKGSYKTKIKDELKKDPYYNALQVKFGYAVTCHKSQGGQWDYAFVVQGYLSDEMVDVEYLRWLYTAITRASKKLYFVNFNEQFFLSESRG